MLVELLAGKRVVGGAAVSAAEDLEVGVFVVVTTIALAKPNGSSRSGPGGATWDGGGTKGVRLIARKNGPLDY